jgi:carbon monoxide dehydrogenase subunit G
MKFDGGCDLGAPVALVFERLNDPAVLQQCIPGCEKMEKTGEDRYNAHMKMGLAAIKGSFVGTVRVTDKQAPNRYTLNIEGRGAPGFVNGKAVIELSAAGERTNLRYSAEAQVGGLIAAVGSRLIEAAAKKMAEEFFARFARSLQPAS